MNFNRTFNDLIFEYAFSFPWEDLSHGMQEKFYHFSIAHQVLSNFIGNHSAMEVFRAVLMSMYEVGPTQISKMNDHEVIDLLAKLLVQGRIRLYSQQRTFGTFQERKTVAVTHKPSPEPPKAPTEDTITIKVVDNKTGKAIPNVTLHLKTPTGQTEHHKTRNSGLIESLGLESGNCEVLNDVDELSLNHMLLYVGIGESPITAPTDCSRLKDPATGSKYQIASAEGHIIKAGETLESVARIAGVRWQSLAKFNWDTTELLVAEEHFDHSDIIYIPKQWSKKELVTNQPHTIRVISPADYIEDKLSIRAQCYSKPLFYIYDPSLNKGTGDFRFVYEGGSLTCSHMVDYDEEICKITPEKGESVEKEKPSFVYADAGCWCDKPKGKEEKRRDFLLVCGPHVYLCEFNRSGNTPFSRVDSVQQFFDEMTERNCGINVTKYICANTRANKIPSDSNLYLFLGDLHLPPYEWFSKPDMRYIFEQGYIGSFNLPSDIDIFKTAGEDLVFFLKALSSPTSLIKQKLNFIQVGDMFELWLHKPYLFKPGIGVPEWMDKDSPNQVVDWVWDIVAQNKPVIDAFQNLNTAGFSSVTYLWGNHDSYLQRNEITKQINIKKREPFFTTSSKSLVCEHGHRFDSANWDNRGNEFFNPSGWEISQTVADHPSFRNLEDIARPNIRDVYLQGATLTYLYQKYNRHIDTFRIYVMAHTHERYLCRFDIKAKFDMGPKYYR